MCGGEGGRLALTGQRQGAGMGGEPVGQKPAEHVPTLVAVAAAARYAGSDFERILAVEWRAGGDELAETAEMAGHMGVQQFERPTGRAAGELGGLPDEVGIAR